MKRVKKNPLMNLSSQKIVFLKIGSHLNLKIILKYAEKMGKYLINKLSLA